MIFGAPPPPRLTRSLAAAFFALALLGFTSLLSAQDFYWEAPRVLADARGRYPTILDLPGGAVAFWQESETVSGSEELGRAWISSARRVGGSWVLSRRFAGPFEFRGSEPVLYSVAAGKAVPAAATGVGATGTGDLAAASASPAAAVSVAAVNAPAAAAPAESADVSATAALPVPGTPQIGPVEALAGGVGVTGGAAIASGAEVARPLLGSTSANSIALAVSDANGAIQVFLSTDGGRRFDASTKVQSDSPAVAPRIFPSAFGGWLLFATRGKDDALTIYYSASADGKAFSALVPFVNGTEGMALNFLPTAASIAGPDGSFSDVVVFQSLSGGSRPTFQLFSKVSKDGGATWSSARPVSDFQDPINREKPNPENFDNQRPFLAWAEGRLWLTWERRSLAGQSQVYAMNLDAEGFGLPGSADRISSGAGSCSAPQIFEIGGKAAVLWFDNRRGGNRVYMALRRGVDWPDIDLSGGQGEASFGRAVASGGAAYIIWQSASGTRDRVLLLEPDTTVAPPALSAVDFTPGKRTRRETATARVDLAPDSSGIEGYSWIWSRDPQAEPNKQVKTLSNQQRLVQTADEDGAWYFAVAAKDFAGNWSGVARLRFERDRTPPSAPLIYPADVDEGGFLLSNSFSVRWAKPDDDDVAGYTWEFRYIGGLERPGVLAAGFRSASALPPLPGLTPYESALVSRSGPPLPPPAILGAKPEVSYTNVDDGYYLLSAAAIDATGNIGSAGSILLRANKYIPFTSVAYADAVRDDFGRTVLRIVGRGYSVDGPILRAALDRDGREPYDVDRSLSDGGFRIASDRELGGIAFEGLEAGDYRIGLYHEKRGWYWTRPSVTVDAAGTIKFGIAAPPYLPSWRSVEPGRSLFSIYDIVVALSAIFAAFGVFLFFGRTVSVLQDGAAVRREVLALLTGGPMPSEAKKEKVVKGRRKLSLLTIKFTITIAFLVLFVVLVSSVSLGVYMIGSESANLARGLEQRALVLLESVAQGGRSYLPSPAQNVLELGFLPQQTKAMKDASYITVTGYGTDASTDPEAVWATNDPGIASKIDGPALRLGLSRISDGLTPKMETIVKEINERAAVEVGDLNAAVAGFTQEGRALATKLDEASQKRLAEISQSSRELERSINEKLFAIADAAASSDPPFDVTKAAQPGGRYLFYKPILYRRGQDQLYYRGMVRIEVSTDIIAAAVAQSRSTVVRIAILIGAGAVGLGLVGAFILASLTVRPIRKVIEAIEKIRDTEDKEELAYFNVERSSNDEIGDLADAANSLRRVLVNAAKESKALEKGSDIQQLLIPLDDAGGDKKHTVGRLDRPEFEIYGYYKGAKKVSGDYWDFRPLGYENRHYYFMKCDVSGKDVEAAFIMVQVVTMVITHFFDWETLKKKPTYDLERLTYRINDFINGRGYRGKFAAFTLGVYDAKDGSYKLCHAGDKLIHTWKAATQKIEIEELHPTPAAGSFPSELVEMKGPYKTVTRRLEPGDILLLYTDGIEEAKRHFRDSNFDVTLCASVPDDEPHENHAGGQDGEEFGFDRICGVLEALETRGRFRLEKHHDPVPDDTLTFDFSGAGETLEERITALIAMEKVFRFFPDPRADKDDAVFVDKRIDAFLEKHFDQHRLYCRQREIITQKRERRTPDGKTEIQIIEDPNYVIYRGIREDEQYDDLTILGLRRKK